MGRLLRIPDLWRLISEADFEGIRRDAERPFQVLLVAGDFAEAELLGRLLSGTDTRHPWLLPTTPEEARRRAGSGLLDAALILTPAADPEPALAAVRDLLIAARVPVVTVPVGLPEGPAALVRPGEAGRAAVALLAPPAVPAVSSALLAAVPAGVRLALARQLPPLRPALFSDLIVLTKNQLVMSYRIALAAGKRGTVRSVLGEVVSVIGGGFLFRQAGRQLIGLIPGAGVAPKVAIAYAGTHAIGRAVAAWADEGHRLSPAAVRRFYAEAWDRARAFARSIVSEARRKATRPRWLRRR
jgi:uncharacterized protein (DUF697 family)